MKVKLQVFNFAESFMQISSRLTLEFLSKKKKYLLKFEMKFVLRDVM